MPSISKPPEGFVECLGVNIIQSNKHVEKLLDEMWIDDAACYGFTNEDEFDELTLREYVEAKRGPRLPTPVQGFYHNRSELMERWKDEELYALAVHEDQVKKFQLPRKDKFLTMFDPSFSEPWFLLPVIATVSERGECIICWTHSELRRNGYGKRLIKLLASPQLLSQVLPRSDLPKSSKIYEKPLYRALYILKGTEKFWIACGFKKWDIFRKGRKVANCPFWATRPVKEYEYYGQEDEHRKYECLPAT